MNLKCIIVEDEPFAQKGMEEFVSRINSLELAGVADDALEALEILNNTPVDLVFLDIQMPGINGLEFLKTITNPPMVILTTAYPEYALNAYDLDVVDYLVKPIPFERFVKAVNKARSYRRQVVPAEQDFFFIKTNKKLERINLADLLYIEAMAHYVMLHTAKKKYITHLSIGNIQEQLPKTFIRTHKSYLVPIDKIESIDADSVFIQGKEIPISKNYRSHLMSSLEGKIFKK